MKEPTVHPPLTYAFLFFQQSPVSTGFENARYMVTCDEERKKGKL